MFAHKLTDNAELRLLEPRHAEELYDVIDRNKERLRMMPFVDFVTSADAEREFTKKALHQFADGLGFHCGLWLHGKLAGGIGMLSIDTMNRTTEIGYWLDEEAEGKGLISAACRAIIEYLFAVTDVNRVVIRTSATNTRSQAVAIRLGFTHEGTQRQAAVFQNEVADVECFSLLKQDMPMYTSGNITSAFFVHNIEENIDLAIFEQRHAEELYTLIDSNRAHLRRWLPWVDETNSGDDTRTFIRQGLRGLAADGTIVAGIRHNGILTGLVGLHSVGIRCKEIGYWLSEAHQGKGLVTKACRALIRHAFVDLGTNRIEIRLQPENGRSRSVAERLGFTYEGTLRQKGIDVEGNSIDLRMYSLLKREWEV